MWQSIVNLLNDLGNQWGKLSMGKKVAAATVFIIVVGSMIALGVWVGEKSYTPLYTNMQPDASIELVKVLQEDKIPYLVGDGGKTVSIPPEFVQQTLMKLAVRGMPGGQKPGLEIFDKESFGTSNYVQRINYVRAIQGELTRTINTLRSVDKSSVHIAMPPKSSFLETSEDPKASVVIKLQPGSTLTKDEIRGIQNLVAFSVEGLRYERVTVVDDSGRALSSNGDTMSTLSTTMLERQKQVEKNLEHRIEEILSRMMGQGNVIARVNADLDFDPLQEQETVYDPEQAVVKVEDKQENNMEASRPAPGGAPAGAQSALPGPANAESESKQSVAKTNARSEFEISNKVRRKEKALGAVKRLSVAVLVNHLSKKDEKGVVTSAPVSDEQRKAIEKLVKDAIGFVDNRDSVTIETSAFASEDLEKADDLLNQQERRHLIFSLIRYGTVALFILLFFTVVVRPFIRWVTGISTTKVETILPKTIEELEAIQEPTTASLPGLASLPLIDETVDLEKAENDLLRDKIISMVEMHPGKAAQILSDWLAVQDQGNQGQKGKGKK